MYCGSNLSKWDRLQRGYVWVQVWERNGNSPRKEGARRLQGRAMQPGQRAEVWAAPGNQRGSQVRWEGRWTAPPAKPWCSLQEFALYPIGREGSQSTNAFWMYQWRNEFSLEVFPEWKFKAPRNMETFTYWTSLKRSNSTGCWVRLRPRERGEEETPRRQQKKRVSGEREREPALLTWEE